MQKIRVKTKENDVEIKCYHKIINVANVKTDRETFKKMCKDGCSNYNNKYSCPPFSPDFRNFVKEKELLVVLFRIDLDQVNYSQFHKVSVANAIMKSRIEKLMRRLEEQTKTKFLSTGACRLCRPCKKKINQPCSYPEKKRYSLEATGVDCNHLAKYCFDFPLLYYKNKTAPKYTCVISAIPLKSRADLKGNFNTLLFELP